MSVMTASREQDRPNPLEQVDRERRCTAFSFSPGVRELVQEGDDRQLASKHDGVHRGDEAACSAT
mgnify:CR=1 FL=1